MIPRPPMPAPSASLGRPQATLMLSRVAHSLYWMSRYIERAENTARLLDVNLQFLADFQDLSPASLNSWESLILSSGAQEEFKALHAVADSHSVTDFLAFELRNPGSILSCVYAARENARMIRDQISLEMWEVINELHLILKSTSTTDVWRSGPQEFFNRIIRASHLFQGLTDATFPRNEGWEFIRFGKMLERADKTTRILDVKYHVLLPSATDVGTSIGHSPTDPTRRASIRSQPTRCASAPGSARTSPTSTSVFAAASGFPPATSAATSSIPPAGPARTRPRTPGSRHGFREPAGWPTIPPMPARLTTATCALPSAATIPTSVRSAARTGVPPLALCGSMSACGRFPRAASLVPRRRPPTPIRPDPRRTAHPPPPHATPSGRLEPGAAVHSLSPSPLLRPRVRRRRLHKPAALPD